MNKRAIALFTLAGACALVPAMVRSQVPPVPHFTDETDAAGNQSRFAGGWEYTVGGGPAAPSINPCRTAAASRRWPTSAACSEYRRTG